MLCVYLGLQNGLDQISVQLTYCDLDTEEICRFEEAFSFFWLERWFQDMMGSLSEMDRFSVYMEKDPSDIHTDTGVSVSLP